MSEDQDKPIYKPNPLDSHETADRFVGELDGAHHPGRLKGDIEEARQEIRQFGSTGEKFIARAGRSDQVLDVPEATPRQKVNRLVFLILALTLFGMVLAYSYTSTYAEYESAKYNALASPKWPSTSGEITSSRLNYEFGWGKGSLSHYVPDVVFRYSVNGKTYLGQQISFPKPKFLSNTDAARVRDSYPIGTKVEVFYDPTNPSTSCLVTGVTQELRKRLRWRLEGHNSDGEQSR
jgi:hypothetical protein